MHYTDSKYKKPRVAIVRSQIKLNSRQNVLQEKRHFIMIKGSTYQGGLNNPKCLCIYYCKNVNSLQSDLNIFNATLIKISVGFSFAEIVSQSSKFISKCQQPRIATCANQPKFLMCVQYNERN